MHRARSRKARTRSCGSRPMRRAISRDNFSATARKFHGDTINRKERSMREDIERVKLLAPDLREGKEYPRSPRETLGGYVLAARAVDKCRAVLAGTQGEYHSNCPLDQRWLKFAEIDYDEFKSFVATGATDEEVAAWISETAKKRPGVDIIVWNNQQRDLRLSDLPRETQEFMEDYIRTFVPRNRPIYHWFDVYDLEEERI